MTSRARSLAEGKPERSTFSQHHSITSSCMCESASVLLWPGESFLCLRATTQTTPPAEIISTKPSAPSWSSRDCRPRASEAQSTLCVQKPRINRAMDQAEGKCVFSSLASNTIQTEQRLLVELTQNNPDSSEKMNKSLHALGF